ncbi:MAG: hypothetical protein D6784_07240 [Chloroflexi bacterium]|nr:MAG: hypothetical protein D6784_07240 [Chloroflexota bacterium]
MAKNPLAEVFGFPPDNLSDTAERYRRNKLCPYNNKLTVRSFFRHLQEFDIPLYIVLLAY